MNAPSSTDSQPFAAFDDALVGQLRQVVTERTATPVRRRSRRPVFAAAGVAAIVAATLGISTLGTSAAFAVDRTSSGDIKISIHRLDDAAGLEKALAAYGIDAKVDYQPAQDSTAPTSLGSPDQVPPGGNVGTSSVSGSATASGPSVGQTSSPTPSATDLPCGAPDALPMTTDLRKDEYVITIPRNSVLTRSDSELKITTTGKIADSLAGLEVSFTVGGASCDFGSMTVTSQAGGH